MFGLGGRAGGLPETEQLADIYQKDILPNVSGNEFIRSFTPYEPENLPGPLPYLTDALAPINFATAAIAPSVPVLGAMFKGPYVGNLAAEMGIDIGARFGAEQAGGELGASVPLFGEQPAWLRGLEGGLIGGLGAAGAIKGVDAGIPALGRYLDEPIEVAPGEFVKRGEFGGGKFGPVEPNDAVRRARLAESSPLDHPGFQNEPRLSGNPEVDRLLSQLPEIDRRVIADIEVFNTADEARVALAKRGIQGAEGHGFAGYLVGSADRPEAFPHEVGHALFHNLPEEMQADWLRVVGRNTDETTVSYVTRVPEGNWPPTAYGTTSAAEDFADSYAIWRLGDQARREQIRPLSEPRRAFFEKMDAWLSGGQSQPPKLAADAGPVMDTAKLFESREGITGRGVPEGRGVLGSGPVRPQTNLFGEVAQQPVFRGDESPAILQARKSALDTLASNREIRRSGVTASEVASGRRAQAGSILSGYESAIAEGKTGAELLDAAVDNIPSGRIIQTNAGAIAPGERDALKDVIAQWLQEDPSTRAFQARTARDVVEAMSSPQGYMPQPAEDVLLRRILGDELTDTISSRHAGFNVEGAKVETPTRPLPLGEQTAPVQPPISALDEGKYVTPEQRAKDFADALEAKRKQGEEFIARLRAGERTGASTMTLGQHGEQLTLDRASPVKGIYPADTPMPRVGTMTPAKIMRVARLALSEVFALPRAIKSSLDLSAPLRQGAMLGWSHPRAAASAFADQLRAFSSPKAAKKIDDMLNARPNARIHKAAGLYRAEWDEAAEITAREEAFLSKIAAKLPGVRASNRAYAAYLNKLRADSFDSVWHSLDELDRTAKNAEALARFINVASGRGELPGVLEGAGPLLGLGFYSPRYVTSRPHALWMAVTGNGSAVARKEAMKTLAAYFTGTGTLLALGSAAGIWEVELDPRSADFGKGRIGPLRYDFWTGYSQLARLAAQMATGETKSTRTGEVYKLDNRAQPLGRFIRGKLNPTAGAGVDQLTESDYKGDSLPGPLDRIIELFSPISVQEIVDAFNDYGWEMALSTLPGFFGAGVSVYEPTAEDALNELARQREYTDAYGNKVSGKNFLELPPGQRDALLKEHPDLATQRIAESSEKAQLAQERTAKLVEDQQGSDRLLDDRRLSNRAWREDLGDRKNELRIRKDEIYASAGTLPGKDPVLDAYYAVVDGSEGPDGKPDWDLVDRYVSALPRSEREYVEENTGLIRIDTPQVRQFEAEKQVITKAGYWEMEDQTWAQVKQVVPALQGYESFDDWRRETEEPIYKAFIDAGVSPEFAERETGKVMQDHSVVEFMNELTSGARMKWIVDNPEAAVYAWRWDYFTPTNDQAEYLNWLITTQGVGR